MCVERPEDFSVKLEDWQTHYFLSLFFGCTCGMPKFLGQGSNPHHRSDNATSSPLGQEDSKLTTFI